MSLLKSCKEVVNYYPCYDDLRISLEILEKGGNAFLAYPLFIYGLYGHISFKTYWIMLCL